MRIIDETHERLSPYLAAGHAPGPWVAYTDCHPGEVEPVVLNDEDLRIQISCAHDATEVATALLVAAAPAMLAACKRYVEEAERFASANHFDISAPGTAYQQARAAIAKATGR